MENMSIPQGFLKINPEGWKNIRCIEEITYLSMRIVRYFTISP